MGYFRLISIVYRSQWVSCHWL